MLSFALLKEWVLINPQSLETLKNQRYHARTSKPGQGLKPLLKNWVAVTDDRP